MANNYTQTSLIIQLPTIKACREAAALATDIRCAIQRVIDKDITPAELPEHLQAFSKAESDGIYAEQFNNSNKLWIYHEEFANIELICAFIQHLLKLHDIKKPMCFEWACTCDKPRVDEFSGGAAIVTQTDIRSHCPRQWINKELKKMQKGNLTVDKSLPYATLSL